MEWWVFGCVEIDDVVFVVLCGVYFVKVVVGEVVLVSVVVWCEGYEVVVVMLVVCYFGVCYLYFIDRFWVRVFLMLSEF